MQCCTGIEDSLHSYVHEHICKVENSAVKKPIPEIMDLDQRNFA